MTRKSDFLAWAGLAVGNYPLTDPSIRFIRHSENLTFLVTEKSARQKYLLRLHKPFTVNFLDERQQPGVIESELLWMDTLRGEAGLPLQPVIRSRQEQLVTSIHLPGSDELVACSLLGWVPGRPYRPDLSNLDRLARQLGRLMASMHNQASAWRPPESFRRPRKGPEAIEQTLEKLAPAVQMGILQPQDYAVLRHTVQLILEGVALLPQTPANWGLIHADLHTGNWLHRRNEVIPIDFSLCGYGYHLFDIATCAGSLGADHPALRHHFLDGYQECRHLPAGFPRLLELFFVASVLGYYAFILPDPGHHEWISSHLPRFVETVCHRLLRGEEFFLPPR
jgi:Ser/Thr protein kinase RdoA (MazF antagonist)